MLHAQFPADQIELGVLGVEQRTVDLRGEVAAGVRHRLVQQHLVERGRSIVVVRDHRTVAASRVSPALEDDRRTGQRRARAERAEPYRGGGQRSPG